MAYEIKNNTGSLFKNDRRQNDNQPMYQGNAMVDGKMKRISVWVRTSKNGTSYMSLAFEDPQQGTQQSAPQPARPQYAPAPAPTPRPAPAPAPADESAEDLPF